MKKTTLQEALNRATLAWSDLPHLLLFAFIGTTFISCIAFADRLNPLITASIPASALTAQLIISFILLALGVFLRIVTPRFKTWPLSATLLSLYFLFINMLSERATLGFGLSALNLILLWTLRNSFHPREFFRYPHSGNNLYGFSTGFFVAACLFYNLVRAFRIYCFSDAKDLIKNIRIPNFGSTLLMMVVLSAFIVLILFRIYRTIPDKATSLVHSQSLLKKFEWSIGGITLLCAAIIGVYFMAQLMLHRIWGFSTPSFDFGLFNQMFAYMKRTGLPLTTIERDGLLSHFKVHFSPIYYLLLPIYYLLPHPETLQLLQLVTVISGVIPLYLIAKHFFLSTLETAALSSLYLVQPGLVLSSLYDLHENCFLAPLLMWLFYAFFLNKKALIAIFTVLLLLVKEDAALYVSSAALFYFFSPLFAQDQFYDTTVSASKFHPTNIIRRNPLNRRIIALLMLVTSFTAFFLISRYLNEEGQGVMMYRFKSLIQYDTEGFLGIIRSLYQNPANFLALIFDTVKIEYLLIISFSLGFIAFFQNHTSSYLLFIPLLVMNLATDYVYQFDITFQYGYGSHAFLVMALLISYLQYKRGTPYWAKHQESKFSQKPPTKFIKRTWCNHYLAATGLCLALLSSGFITGTFISQKQYYVKKFKENPERFIQTKEALDRLPRDKSIAANTFFTTYLADIPELYCYENNKSIQGGRKVDLLVFDNHKMRELETTLHNYFSNLGYSKSVEFSTENIYVLERSDSDPNADGSKSFMP